MRRGERNQPKSGYKIRAKERQADGTPKASLTVPQAVARLIPEGTRFTVELVEEGLLYRRVVPKPAAPSYRPTWVEPAEDELGRWPWEINEAR